MLIQFHRQLEYFYVFTYEEKLTSMFILDVIREIALHICRVLEAAPFKTLTLVFTQCKHVILTTRAFRLMFREMKCGVNSSWGDLLNNIFQKMFLLSAFSFCNGIGNSDWISMSDVTLWKRLFTFCMYWSRLAFQSIREFYWLNFIRVISEEDFVCALVCANFP